jgi:hypothetical protein
MGGLWSRYLFSRARSLWKAGMIILIYHSFGRLFLQKNTSTINSLLEGFKNSTRQQKIGQKKGGNVC